MEIIKRQDITKIKMSTNPPQCVVDADYCIIFKGTVYQWIGIGWIEIRKATIKDTEAIPLIPEPECSICVNYTVTPDRKMYCKSLCRKITARKKVCKKFYQI